VASFSAFRAHGEWSRFEPLARRQKTGQNGVAVARFAPVRTLIGTIPSRSTPIGGERCPGVTVDGKIIQRRARDLPSVGHAFGSLRLRHELELLLHRPAKRFAMNIAIPAHRQRASCFRAARCDYIAQAGRDLRKAGVNRGLGEPHLRSTVIPESCPANPH